MADDSKVSGADKFGLSVFALKIIAILTMLIDHIGAGLYPTEIWFRLIGRLAFPIFAFLICEGFCHTRNVKRYAVRLGIFALISEIPFNLLHGDHFFDPDAQNIFFTLLIGLLTIYGIKKLARDGGTLDGGNRDSAKTVAPGSLGLAQLLVLIAGLFVAQILRTDYGAFGVAIIFIFYLLRERRGLSLAFMAAANVTYGLINLAYGFMPLQAMAAAAAVPIMMYNGEKGPSARYAFYAFYPAHITVIMAIKYLTTR